MMSSARPRVSVTRSVATFRCMRSRISMSSRYSKRRARHRDQSGTGPIRRRGNALAAGSGEVVDAAAQCRELRIVRLGHVDPERLVQRDDETQEVERIELQRLAQAVVRREAAELRPGTDT